MKHVGMGVDFDPVHKGHIHLIKEAKKIGDVYAYVNEDYTAHHAPPFLSYEARQEICEALGVTAVPVKGLHYRRPLSYTVPIRIDMMARDGITDIMDAAASQMSIQDIMAVSREFAEKGMLMGIPRSWPDRNLIRWVAANELHAMRHKGQRMGYHITTTYKIDNETVSGRYIRKAIMEAGRVTAPVRHLVPPETVTVIERELTAGTLNLERDMDALLHVANTFSKSKLLKLANINVDAAEEIVKGRPYQTEEMLRYPLRRAGYQHVLSSLAVSCLERRVTRKEVCSLINNYEKKGITPTDQTISSLVARAYFVARASQLTDTSIADAIFRAGIDSFWDGDIATVAKYAERTEDEVKDLYNKISYEEPPESLLAGVALRQFELNKVTKRTVCELTSQGGVLYAELRIPKQVMIGKLKLPAQEVTFLRYLLDSQMVPVSAYVEFTNDGKLRIRIRYGDTA